MVEKIEKIELDKETLQYCWVTVSLTDGSSYLMNLLDMLEFVEEHTEDLS